MHDFHGVDQISTLTFRQQARRPGQELPNAPECEASGETVIAIGTTVLNFPPFTVIAEHDLGLPARYASPYPVSVSTTEQLDIFNELRSEDELLVLARGLGLIRVVTNLLHSYDAAGNNLIIVIGADERENGWIGEGEARSTLVRGTNVDFR